jgi:hypothetical protein
MSLLILFPAPNQSATTGTITATQAAASWTATLSERLTSTGGFAQTASWDAAASQRLTATGEFAQSATWAGVITHTDSAVSGPATFFQSEPDSVATVVLKIMGYASLVPPQQFLDATGTVLEEWVP